MKRWLPAAIVVVAIDQLTKAWAQRALSNTRVIDLPGPAALRLSYNTGVAFGQGRGWGIGPVIAALGMVIIGILVLRVAKRANPRLQVVVGVVVGGAVGNLVDRLVQAPGWFRGPVIDFIQIVPWFPIFNVADMAITLGGLGLVLAMANDANTADTSNNENDSASTPDSDESSAGETDSEPDESGDPEHVSDRQDG